MDEVRELTDGRGVDVVITAASGAAQEDALQMAAPSGRLSFFGGLPNDQDDLRPRGGQGRAQAPGRGSDPLIRSTSSSRYSRTA